jgi:hypothetical protein
VRVLENAIRDASEEGGDPGEPRLIALTQSGSGAEGVQQPVGR